MDKKLSDREEPATQSEFALAIKERTSYYHYGICILDHVLCEIDEIKLSDFVTLKKARMVTDPLGKHLLGDDALQASERLASKKWNDVSDLTTSIFPPFNPNILPPERIDISYYRKYEISDCVLEIHFEENDPEQWNKNLQTVNREIEAVLTSMRLLGDAPIRIIGPVALDTHGALHKTLPASPVLSLSNLNHERRSGRVEEGAHVEIDANVLDTLKNLFGAISGKLPEWLEVALNRLNISCAPRSEVDQLIDTIIGLEALYLYGVNSEVSFKFALRVAAHQEPKPEGRLEKFNVARFLYNARSRVVHGGIGDLQTVLNKKDSPFETPKELIDGARNLLRIGCVGMLSDLISTGSLDKHYHDRLDEVAVQGIPWSYGE